MAPAEWVTVTPTFAFATSWPFTWARMPWSVAVMAPLLSTVTLPLTPSPSCETKMPRATAASALPMAPLLVTVTAPPPPLATTKIPSSPASMAPLLVTVTAPPPPPRMTLMPPFATLIVPAWVTVIVPPGLPASVSAAWMPRPSSEVSVTPSETETSTEPAS